MDIPASSGDIGAARDAVLAGAAGFDVVDLSDTLTGRTVLWPGTPPIGVVEEASHDRDGHHVRTVTVSEHAGTHFDAPEHFVRGGTDVSRIPAEQLAVAARVIDFTREPLADGNAALRPADVEAHEAAHGRIPAGAAVLLHTGWSARRDDVLAYAGSTGAEHLVFPGFGIDAAMLLVERGVVGLGVDTLGIDPGDAVDFPVHRDVTHPHGLWHLENLVHLDRLPPDGSVVVVGVPRIEGASGFPARVLALVPR